MSMSSPPQGAEAFRHRQPYASSADAERHRTLMPGVERHQLWDAPVPSSRASDSVERISMEPPRQRHRSIRFGDEPLESARKGVHSGPISPTAPRMTGSMLTASPPAMRYEGLPPSSNTAVSPFEIVDPFTETARPVDYNSPSLESASTDSLDQHVANQARSPHAHSYPRRNSDSDREESVSLVANPDGSSAKGGDIRLVKRV
jgi:hypothetical protein